MADCVEDSVLAKVGEELFKELLRLYRVAEPTDYFKQGKWSDALMRQDLQLYWYHRSEAGSPDPIPLASVVVPELPVEKPISAVAFTGSAVLQKPAATVATNGSSPSNLSTLRETMAKLAAARGAGGALTVKTASSSSSINLLQPAGIAAAGKVAVSDLKEIALFVAKFKFEPAKVKQVLGKLDGNKRRYVIQNFSSDAAAGKPVTTALEDYVAELEVSNDWDGFSGEAVAASPAKAPVKHILAAPKAGANLLGANLLSVKRPAPAASAEEPASKVARVGAVGGVGVTTAAAVAARLAAARTASALTANLAAKKAGASPAWAQPAKATVALRPGAAKWAGGAGKA